MVTGRAGPGRSSGSWFQMPWEAGRYFSLCSKVSSGNVTLPDFLLSQKTLVASRAVNLKGRNLLAKRPDGRLGAVV